MFRGGPAGYMVAQPSVGVAQPSLGVAQPASKQEKTEKLWGGWPSRLYGGPAGYMVGGP